MRHLLSLLLAITYALVLSACSTRTLGYPAGDGGDSCDGLSSADCAANPACQWATYPGCCGATTFFCISASEHVSPPACPELACNGTSCSGLDEAACKANPACGVLTCPGCSGPVFALCWDKSHSPPRLQCSSNCAQACDQLGESDCAARTDCHRVFNDAAKCLCDVPGCCEAFSFCADGPANCQSTCLPATNICGPGYVADYLPNGCTSDGCVLLSDCRP